MKKVLNQSKFPTPSKLVRRVLSRTSNESKASQLEVGQSQASTSGTTSKSPQSIALELELTSLREQLSILQMAVSNMQEDAEKREKALANLAREKQQLSTDLRREKRSSTSLKEQLEEEREFYHKQKEQYCQEMNDCKKLKKKISQVAEGKRIVSKEESPDLLECRNQVLKLKSVLNQTLEANYSLSVKFLRMKNTKINLKNRLKKQESDHEQAMQNLQLNINNIKNDIADVVDKRFTLPISPSNKRYLQIIKQNGMLMHENLCLQTEVERLNRELEYVKSTHHFQEIPCKLKDSHSNSQQKDTKKSGESQQTSTKSEKVPEAKERTKSTKSLQKTGASKSKRASLSSTLHESKEQSDTKNDKKTQVIKIFEKEKAEGIPEIIMLPQSNEQVDTLENVKLQNTETIKANVPNASTKGSQKNSSMQISENHSQMDTDLSDLTYTISSREAIRTQSAPEIVQTSSFVSKFKS